MCTGCRWFDSWFCFFLSFYFMTFLFVHQFDSSYIFILFFFSPNTFTISFCLNWCLQNLNLFKEWKKEKFAEYDPHYCRCRWWWWKANLVWSQMNRQSTFDDVYVMNDFRFIMRFIMIIKGKNRIFFPFLFPLNDS